MIECPLCEWKYETPHKEHTINRQQSVEVVALMIHSRRVHRLSGEELAKIKRDRSP